MINSHLLNVLLEFISTLPDCSAKHELQFILEDLQDTINLLDEHDVGMDYDRLPDRIRAAIKILEFT